MSERIIGLDGEMSGSEINDGYRLIQIGLAVDTKPDGGPLGHVDVFRSLIGWDADDMAWSERAYEVHGITKETVVSAPRAGLVDEALVAWLRGHGFTDESRRRTILTGFNVGAFDAPFVHSALPKSAAFFSRRYADLNPLLFMLATSLTQTTGLSNSDSYKRLFRRVGLEAAEQHGLHEGEHDAAVDAVQALAAWRHVEQMLRSVDADAKTHRNRLRAERKAGLLDAASVGLVDLRTL